MARYQLLRPSPVQIFPRRVRQQQATTSKVLSLTQELEEDSAEIEVFDAAVEKEEQGLDSPNSPLSSPSTVGGADDSDSEDEAETKPSAAVSSGAAVSSQEAIATSKIASVPASSLMGGDESTFRTSIVLASSADATSAAQLEPASKTSVESSPQSKSVANIASERSNVALSQITTSVSSRPTSKIVAITTEGIEGGSKPTQPAQAGSTSSSSIFPAGPAQSERAGDRDPPARSSPQGEPPILTKSGATAAIVLGVLGALALIIGAFVFLKRRKRRQNAYHQRLGDDAFNPTNSGSLRAPETAHIDNGLSFLKQEDPNTHLTRSTDRSNTLFGPASYSRPETVSTDRNTSRPPLTPNPFADPPLNKAYDVLAGRPRSTTLTDRGSWIKNPFKNPDSERFDPFGELQEKARRERVKHLEQAQREAELMLEYEEREKQYAAKEKMGLALDALPKRNGSGATVEGVGVLDRTGGGTYR